MKKKRFLFLGLVFLVIFIIGCQGSSKQPVKTGTFYGGTEGVSVSFVDVFPPSKIDQRDTVPVKILLENKGEYDLVSGMAKAKLYGINLNAFSLNGNYIGTKS